MIPAAACLTFLSDAITLAKWLREQGARKGGWRGKTYAMTLSTPSEGGMPPRVDSIEPGSGPPMPTEPPGDLIYHHQTQLRSSLAELWDSRDIVFTLAERDIRAQYKQATLGLLWALIAPLAMLAIFSIIFSREKQLGIPGIPYEIFAYIGITCWTFFSSALGTGGTSLLTNHLLMNKTQFPRECFPLETLLVTAVNTVLAWIPLAVLFAIYGFAPTFPTSLWVLVLIVIELLFTLGVTLGMSALIIQMRDLAQVLPIVIQLGLFATPVIWQFKSVPAAWRIPYGFFNPLGNLLPGAGVSDLQAVGGELCRHCLTVPSTSSTCGKSSGPIARRPCFTTNCLACDDQCLRPCATTTAGS
jgi:ABC-type polysaccharide/polyol phosphate export permease